MVSDTRAFLIDSRIESTPSRERQHCPGTDSDSERHHLSIQKDQTFEHTGSVLICFCCGFLLKYSQLLMNHTHPEQEVLQSFSHQQSTLGWGAKDRQQLVIGGLRVRSGWGMFQIITLVWGPSDGAHLRRKSSLVIFRVAGESSCPLFKTTSAPSL